MLDDNALALMAIDSVLEGHQSYCKFLSANDSGETGGHQSGVLISKSAKSLFFTDDELANLTDYSEKIYDIVRTVKLTYHEGADGKVQIVNTFLHNKIGHAGGVFLAKMRETITVGVDYLKWILYGIELSYTHTHSHK